MRRILLLILLLPSAAANVDFMVPQTMSLHDGVFLSGDIAWHTDWTNPIALQPETLQFDAGALTVCERNGQGSSLLEQLANARRDCPGAVTYDVQELIVEGTSHLQFEGRYPGGGNSAYGFATLSGGTTPLAGFVLAEPFSLQTPRGGIGFAAVKDASSIRLELGDGNVWYNGTDWLFLHEGATMQIGAGAIGGGIATGARLSVSPANNGLPAVGANPFLLLDVQEAILGGDEREARANVTAVFGEFGRIPLFVDGALMGMLNGTASGNHISPKGPSLVRFDAADLVLSADRLAGETRLRFHIGEDGLQLAGATRPASPPWWWAATFWVVAAAVLIVRRHTPQRDWWQTSIPFATILLASWVVDYRSLASIFGTSASALAISRDWSGAGLALLTFQTVILVMSAGLLWAPLRLIGAKVVPDGWTWVPDIAASIAWLIILWFAPASMFALGYAFARL